ncbi:DUF6668 family protein [Agromyces sp. S2-1-8]|uniref:DUF6668 family protein n=1 Tax=Agromyces sp. S2-1-8 TaxID=2897180 RepID=UPI001E442FA0|nr:DUF6668 family protein [Agromyces sp. S2-1-8]MCD5348425.1 hypothetical protein [Agromyces sp. S2-1-8]
MSNTNPWVTTNAPQAPTEGAAVLPPAAVAAEAMRPSAPQPGVPAPDTADRLPRVQQYATATVWWVGVHGGAGESTLAALGGHTAAAGHAWPMPAQRGIANRVVLVARTNHAGLTAAQRAATEWASGELGDVVQLLGLVLIADAPGRLPKPLRHLAEVISGGVPRTWRLQWHEPWRLGAPVTLDSAPSDARSILTDLQLPISAGLQR